MMMIASANGFSSAPPLIFSEFYQRLDCIKQYINRQSIEFITVLVTLQQESIRIEVLRPKLFSPSHLPFYFFLYLNKKIT